METFVAPIYRNQTNSQKRTPREFFSIEHKELMKDGEKWIKKNATSCLLVATLIVTVVYPATLTVPGNNNNNNNVLNASSTVPDGNNCNSKSINNQTEKTLIILAIFNTIAMASSTTSIVMFFSILISRYAEEDFILSLPFKFKFGLISLSASLLTMMASFCITSVINYVHRGPKWIHFFIFSSPAVPTIALGFFLLYPLLRDLFRPRI